MTEPSESGDVKRSRTVITLIEVLVVFLVIGVLAALLLPAVEHAGEAARRVACNNQLKMIALATHNYTQATRGIYPPGTLCNSRPATPGNQYDVWTEAAKTGPEYRGTSFLLPILPYIEEEFLYKKWASGQKGSGTTAGCWSPAANVGTVQNPGPAIADIKLFYCPTRRPGFRTQDSVTMPSPVWTGGGTDYGGCAGRHAAFTLDSGYNLCDASMRYEPDFQPANPSNKEQVKDAEKSRWGIFGRVNVCTLSSEIRDGSSYTILVGELSRITNLSHTTLNANSGPSYSKDGWSIGGPATLFTTGAMAGRIDSDFAFVDSPTTGRLMNNGFFGSPGSEHNNGANYGLADGSVRYLITTMDPNTFALMGSMFDQVKLDLDSL
jgi:prepilin-type processing-associated H-X9-DG protein